jgi:hypothetical protein
MSGCTYVINSTPILRVCFDTNYRQVCFVIQNYPRIFSESDSLKCKTMPFNKAMADAKDPKEKHRQGCIDVSFDFLCQLVT